MQNVVTKSNELFVKFFMDSTLIYNIFTVSIHTTRFLLTDQIFINYYEFRNSR